jgi:hypothetical protein
MFDPTIDVDLIVKQLRKRGHTVSTVIPVPDNAGNYEFGVDGALLTLDQTRLLLERDMEPVVTRA